MASLLSTKLGRRRSQMVGFVHDRMPVALICFNRIQGKVGISKIKANKTVRECTSSYVGYQYNDRTIRFQFVNCVSNENQDSKAAHKNVMMYAPYTLSTLLRKVPTLDLVHGSAQ